ncbi:MAG: hypothetical protein Q8L47_03685 [bacterium]|nr:hypothetical protein [bacterium]
MTKKVSKRLPKKLYPYFWEVDISKLDIKRKKIYVLTRLLEYGRPEAIRWAWKYFSKRDFCNALKSREVSSQTRNFWTSLIK